MPGRMKQCPYCDKAFPAIDCKSPALTEHVREDHPLVAERMVAAKSLRRRLRHKVADEGKKLEREISLREERIKRNGEGAVTRRERIIAKVQPSSNTAYHEVGFRVPVNRQSVNVTIFAHTGD